MEKKQLSIVEKLFEIQNSDLKFVKDATNPFFKSNYLSLEGLMEVLGPALFEHKLLVVHGTVNKEVMTKVLCVETGDNFISSFPLPDTLKPQEIGSAITYAKRYNLGQIFNIITDEDDDGSKASGNKKVESKTEDDLNL